MTCLGGVTAEEEQQQEEVVVGEAGSRSFSGFFSSKLGDLYKMRQSLLDSMTMTTTPTTTTTTTTTTDTDTDTTTASHDTSSPALPSSTLGWSSRAEGNSAFQSLYDMLKGVEDPQQPLQLENVPDGGLTKGKLGPEGELTKVVMNWRAANGTFDPQLPLSNESLADDGLTEEVLVGELTKVRSGLEGELEEVTNMRSTSDTIDPQLSLESLADGGLTEELDEGLVKVKSEPDGELKEELTDWKATNDTFDPQLPLSNESLADGGLTEEVTDGGQKKVESRPAGELKEKVTKWRSASDTIDPQLPLESLADGGRTEEVEEGAIKVKSEPDGELKEELTDWKATNDTSNPQFPLSHDSLADDGLLEVRHWKAVNNTVQIPNPTPAAHGEPEDHWARVKGIFENMKSILQQMYPGEATDVLGFSFFDRAIALGDKMHLLQDMVQSFDPALLEYLSAKWEDTKGTLVNYPIIKSVISSSTQELGWSLLVPLMHQVGGILQRQAFTHVAELDFVTELMRTSGFKDREIRKVYELLDLPVGTLDGADTELQEESRQFQSYGYLDPSDSGDGEGDAEPRQYNNYPGYNTLDKSGGYGHSGGGGYGGMHGGYGGGYGYMQGFDPFVLLAGLAFATFLAYLIYRLLSSTAGGGRREAPDVTLALDLSDLPGVMNNLYSWLEGAKEQYEDAARTLVEEGHSLGWAANHLWANYQVDRLSRACVRRALCDTVKATQELDAPDALLEHLALTGLAQLFGEDNTAAYLDHVSSRLVKGKSVHCEIEAPDCDEDAYRGTPRHPQGPDIPDKVQGRRIHRNT
ncbi:uncharacterized protein LOC126983699 [Eriocheir sinensis]|uniref:uncharacterized protein LOC126983699 n=1 Tax=Eriocheir sinensis TaxID=95602 RepID=UPI0021C87BB2|nr:uncharacterized protein LOC126983699 [Eriocheir sinensis]